MGVHSHCKGALILGFLLSLLLVGSFCQADDKINVEVVGAGECSDCEEYNIKASHAFKGLRVTIDCKIKDWHFKTKGVGELDEQGKFKVSLPKDSLEDEEECYAQLHSAFSAPCPAHNGLEATKIIVAKSKHTLEPAEKLKFSTALCTSAFLWPHFKHPAMPKWPPLPKWPSYPKIDHAWKHHFGHHFKFPPIYKKPLPPIYKPQPPPTTKKPEPPAEPKKPKPPPAPEKPKTPVEKPHPPPVPIKKPCPPIIPKPPPVPIKKPFPPIISKPHPIPIKKPHPIPIKKHFPPIIPKPHPIPIKKPFPPIIPKIPKIPKIHPKYFHHHHPYFPPLPPHFPHA